MTIPTAKDALIATALDELAAAAPSLGARDIARKAGVNHGLIPYYFNDSTGLLLASIEVATAQYLAMFDRLADPVVNDSLVRPAQIVGTIVAWALDVIQSDPDHFARRRTICAMAKDNPNVAKQAQRLIATEVEMTSRFVAAVRDCPEPTSDDHATAGLLVALFDGLAAQKALGIETDAQTVSTMVQRMIGNPENGLVS